MEKLLRAGFAALGLPLDETALTRFETYYAPSTSTVRAL